MGATAPAVPCRQGIVPNHPRRLCGSVSVRRCGFPRPVVPRGRASRADCPRSSARSRSPRPIAHALAVASCMPCLCPFRARRGSAHSRCSLIRPPSWRRVSAPPPPCPSRSRRLTVPRVIRPVEPSPPVCERRSWSQSSFGRPRPMWPVRGACRVAQPPPRARRSWPCRAWGAFIAVSSWSFPSVPVFRPARGAAPCRRPSHRVMAARLDAWQFFAHVSPALHIAVVVPTPLPVTSSWCGPARIAKRGRAMAWPRAPPFAVHACLSSVASAVRVDR